MGKNSTSMFENEYSDESFWEKLQNFAQKAGCKVVYTGLLLYYTFQKESTPLWAKTVIIGALGYFISPLDAIPDVLLGIGFTDDLGVLAAAMGIVLTYIDSDVKQKARQKLKDWFDDGCASEIDNMEY